MVKCMIILSSPKFVPFSCKYKILLWSFLPFMIRLCDTSILVYQFIVNFLYVSREFRQPFWNTRIIICNVHCMTTVRVIYFQGWRPGVPLFSSYLFDGLLKFISKYLHISFFFTNPSSVFIHPTFFMEKLKGNIWLFLENLQ